MRPVGRDPAFVAMVLAGVVANGCGAPPEELGGSDGRSGSEVYAVPELPCFYVAAATEEEPEPGFESHEGCASVGRKGRPVIDAGHLSAVAYADGLAEMHISGGWHYVRRDGASLRVVTWDNGPDAWSEGLARSVRDGRIVYSNEAFEEVIGPTWDWGWPFEGGLALVCSGCEIVEEAGSEHRSVVGGRWGFIDASGTEVVPVRYDREGALASREALPGDY